MISRIRRILAPTPVVIVFGVVLGAVPFAVVPGIGPAVLVLAVAIWVVVALHLRTKWTPHVVEMGVLVLLLTSAVAVAVTADSARHLSEFVKWAVATAVIFPLFHLGATARRRFLLAYVGGATTGGAISLILLVFDRSGTALAPLAPFGYGAVGPSGTTLRTVDLDGRSITRLAGLYVDPNIAGLFMVVALALALALTRGRALGLTAPILAVATVASLSRSAIATVVMAGILFVAVHSLSARARSLALGAGAVACLGALGVPAVRERFLASFGSTDRGADDRMRALENFVPSMQGDWWFGKGWGAIELIDEVAGYNANFVANTPLLTLYRGGMIVGLTFLVLLVLIAAVSVRRLRSSDARVATIGATALAVVLVALQLDFPVVTIAPVTMVFGVLIVATVTAPVDRALEARTVPTPEVVA